MIRYPSIVGSPGEMLLLSKITKGLMATLATVVKHWKNANILVPLAMVVQ